MFLERRIKKPFSLDAAMQEFTQWCREHGYEISSIASHWQHNLFYPELDAIIEAQVRKVKK
jgi:hypothetical protein